MWAAATEPSGLAEPAFWTFLGVCVATLGTFAVQWLKGRQEKAPATAPSSPPPLETSVALQFGAFGERLKVHGERLDDGDDRFEVVDRRQDHTETDVEMLKRWAKHHDPDWWT